MISNLPFLLQVAAPVPQATPGGGLPLIVLQLTLIVAIFYFLMIRPQQKQRREQESALNSLKKGDEVVTVGGVVGEIVSIKETLVDGAPRKTPEDRVTLKSGESKIVVHRGRIHGVLKSTGTDA